MNLLNQWKEIRNKSSEEGLFPEEQKIAEIARDAIELIAEIETYTPWNEQEEKDKYMILHCLGSMENIFSRKNQAAHMTASAWTVNKNRDKVLMAYHNIYRSWAWLGGHADGEKDLLFVALKEVKEESGITRVRPVFEDIYSLEVLTVDGHVKKGVYVPSHLHLNITYLLEADESEQVAPREGENSKVGWFPLGDAVKRSSEPWFQKYVYPKLNEKLQKSSCKG